MARIVFPSGSSPGDHPNEDGGRLINAMAEQLGADAPAPYVLKRTPGLDPFSDTGQTGFRGCFYDPPYIFSAWNGTLRKTTSAGVTTAVGTLAGSDTVFFARNNRTPTPDYVLVCGAGTFTFTPSSIAPLVDPDLPIATSVTFGEGYFFFGISDSRVFASGLNATTVNANDFMRTESTPRSLLRVDFFNGELYCWKESSCEVWASRGNPNATGFPLNRTTTIWRGLRNPQCLAGGEEGFAPVKVFVADDDTVCILDGYNPVKISPPWVDRLIKNSLDKTKIQAFDYSIAGHPSIVIRSPTFCVVYDLASKEFYERASYLGVTWRALGNCVHAFDKWIAGDAFTGYLVEIEDGCFDEMGLPMIWEIHSAAMENFPARIKVPRADFNFDNGVGYAADPRANVVDPTCEIAYTDDSVRWSTPLLRKLGQQGRYYSQITVTRQGMSTSKGRRYRLRVADPVYVGFLSGDMAAQERGG